MKRKMIHQPAISDQATKAIEQGLNKAHKSLPHWLLYDDIGFHLFRQITKMPFYYIDRCEMEIIQAHKEDLFRYFTSLNKGYSLIDVGIRNNTTGHLLSYLHAQQPEFTYKPVDPSLHVINELVERLKRQLPTLHVTPIHTKNLEKGDVVAGEGKKAILLRQDFFGNLTLTKAFQFLVKMSTCQGPDDLALIGFDLKKDPAIITASYNDKTGLTKEFNLNALRRLNQEFGARFDTKQFDHYASYDPQTGIVKNFLLSLKDQDVFIDSMNKSFHFAHWETVCTHISQKYDLLMMEKLISDAGLIIVDLFFDADQYSCEMLVKKS